MKLTFLLLFSLFLVPNLPAQTPQPAANAFVEIEKALKTYDLDSFYTWLANTIDLEILGTPNICSKNQAKQMLKNFFAKYTPKNFAFIHQSGNGKVQYGIGQLTAGGEIFRITIFVYEVEKKYAIQQIRIEKSNKN